MKFSIVTPSFRQVDWLKSCSASIADQRGDFEIEHLIHDGASGAEFDAWAADQEFSDCISEPDEGMYDAINRGFLRVRGDVVAWLNSDEQYVEGALAKVAAHFRSHPETDVLFCDVVVIADDGTPEAYRQAAVPWRRLIMSCHLPTHSAATFVRRSAITAGHLLDTRWRTISDAVWIERLLAEGYRAAVLNEPIATFTRTGDNLGQSPLALREMEAWRRETGHHGFLSRKFWSSLHRCAKLLTGAYRSRAVEIDVFPRGGSERTKRSARVGGIWQSEARRADQKRQEAGVPDEQPASERNDQP